MSRYRVTLALTMEADTPSDAVQDVVDVFTEHGVRQLIYVVNDADGTLVGYFDGWGEQVNTETVELAAAVRQPRSVAADAHDDVALDDTDLMDDDHMDDDEDKLDASDAELEELAESLNAESEPASFNVDEFGIPGMTDEEGDELHEALNS